MKAWFFSRPDRRLRHGDGRLIEPGVTHEVEGTPILYLHGLHASRRLINAMACAPGLTVWRVELGGEIVEGGELVEGDDKVAAQRRTYLWGYDATDEILHFSRRCALGVSHLWDAPDSVAHFLATGENAYAAYEAASAADDVDAVAAASAAYAAKSEYAAAYASFAADAVDAMDAAYAAYMAKAAANSAARAAADAAKAAYAAKAEYAAKAAKAARAAAYSAYAAASAAKDADSAAWSSDELYEHARSRQDQILTAMIVDGAKRAGVLGDDGDSGERVDIAQAVEAGDEDSN